MEQSIVSTTEASAMMLAISLGLNEVDAEDAIRHCGNNLPCIEKFLKDRAVKRNLQNNKTIEDASKDLEKILKRNNQDLNL
ncbi:MAG: hypothetical protein PHE67_10170 [Campylobacterales bacterium]|nr:hypothetical protein [Campylobacterales bacterium]